MPRKRTPVSELVKTGAYRPDRHADRLRAPAEDGGTTPEPPPAWLNPLAAAEWDRLFPLLASRGALRPEHHSLLAVYCGVFSQIQATLGDGGAPPAALLTSFGSLAGRLALSPADAGKAADAKAQAIIPGKIADREKWNRVLVDHGKPPMPPEGGEAA